jgi:leucyl aminopeptidase (aminopeptidase T)
MVFSSLKRDPDVSKALSYVVRECGGVQAGERVLVICDAAGHDLAQAMAAVASVLGAHAEVAEIADLSRHGGEPPADVARRMLTTDLTISLCRFSLAHSRARSDSAARGRFLSLPQYDWALLSDPAVMVDYQAQAATVRRFADAFTKGLEVGVKTRLGTDVLMSIQGRSGNYCPGFVRAPGDLGSPPDIEANIAPIETSAEGTVVVDGSITHHDLGLLATPVTLTLEAGLVVEIQSARHDYIRIVEEMFGPPGSRRRVLAECGVGLNPLARLTGSMLTDEGAMGSVHFGFGANHTVGGLNDVDFHMDFVIRHASLCVDGVPMLADGALL